MTLRKRLAKLEAKRDGRQLGPRIIITDVYWRDDEGNLQSIAQIAKVLTGSGWANLTRMDDEAEAEFQARADALAM